ncbi:hypothetical protein [Pseudomonas atacamensis]|uniref:hypothetical protein n=1 Tax=Pseudomonas atacamensis TaxID=2565368 RepID=UPI0024488906|nr:hypothetical protein [Pseudomonas atacamensis]MDH2080306.1 hypothetical protein [Pseudomonas atacamensis]
MSWKTWDWKFVATTVIAIAALVVPQIDLSSRSLTVRLLSSSPLQPALNIQNLQISLNGQNVESPYVSTIELVNTGSKPITSADFDGALQVLVANNAKLVSAEITSSTPKNIPAQLTTSENKTAISPFLSNPKDSVTIAAITSGPRPVFDVRARIVGINEVGFEDTTVRTVRYWPTFVGLVTAAGLLFMYFIFGTLARIGRHVTIPRGFAFCTSAFCAFGGVKLVSLSLTDDMFDGLPNPNVWALAIGLVSTVFIGMLAHRYLRRLIRARRVDEQTSR